MNSQFSAIEFKNMMFNPIKVPDGVNVFSVIKELGKYKTFKKSPGPEIDNNKLMLWIMCMYDMKSPYRKKFNDVLQRKSEVAKDVGFKVEPGGIFERPVDDFMIGRNKVVNDKITEYVRIHRNFKYSLLVSMENSYYTIMTQVMEGKNERIKDLKSIQKDMEETLLEIYNDDNNPFLNDSMLRYIEADRLGLRPEDIASRVANGEPAIIM